MDTKELKIKNLVFDKYSGIMEISCINAEFNEVWIRKNELLPSGLCNINEIKSIPLTEEWLLKLGLKKYNSFWFEIYNKPNFTININLQGNVTLERGGRSDEILINRLINHVHQLQNLIFALTGEELQINEP